MYASTSAIDQNLILTGYIGPTQLAITRRVAERLRLPLVDFDMRFEERYGMAGDEVRALFGEARLKTLENELVSELLLYRGAVLRISGGTLLRGDTLTRTSSTGPVLCLYATLDAVLQRLHLSLGMRYHNPRERELALGTLKREWAIRAHPSVFPLDTSYMTDAQVVDAVAAEWRARATVIEWHPI